MVNAKLNIPADTPGLVTGVDRVLGRWEDLMGANVLLGWAGLCCRHAPRAQKPSGSCCRLCTAACSLGTELLAMCSICGRSSSVDFPKLYRDFMSK